MRSILYAVIAAIVIVAVYYVATSFRDNQGAPTAPVVEKPAAPPESTSEPEGSEPEAGRGPVVVPVPIPIKPGSDSPPEATQPLPPAEASQPLPPQEAPEASPLPTPEATQPLPTPDAPEAAPLPTPEATPSPSQ